MDCGVYQEIPGTFPKDIKLKIKDKPYELGKLLGSGEYGKVNFSPDNRTVIKTYYSPFSGLIEICLSRVLMPPFTYEDDFVTPISVYLSENNVMVEMKRGNGDLGNYINEKKIGDKLKLVRDITFNLYKLHRLNFAHLDLKPENIIMFGDKPKLADFGLSHMNSCYSTLEKEAITVTYRPPEMLSNLPYDPMKADIWSLGIIILQVYLGFNPVWAYIKYKNLLPIEYNKKDIEDAVKKVINVLFLDENNPDFMFRPNGSKKIPENVKDWVHDMLHFNPEDRPSSEEIVGAPEKSCAFQLKHLSNYPQLDTDLSEPRKELIKWCLENNISSNQITETIYFHDLLKMKESKSWLTYFKSYLYQSKTFPIYLFLSSINRVYRSDIYYPIKEIIKSLKEIDFRTFPIVAHNFIPPQIPESIKSVKYEKMCDWIEVYVYKKGLQLEFDPDILSTAILWIALSYYGTSLNLNRCEKITKKTIKAVNEVINTIIDIDPNDGIFTQLSGSSRVSERFVKMKLKVEQV